MITCIIPARGGSKGIPKKNLVPVCGKPLIGWTIEQALASRRIRQVIVASDDFNIGEYARSLGAEWFLRGDETTTDEATSESALLEVLDCLEHAPELIVFLQCTSPIRQPGDIDAAIDRVFETQADSLFSARHVEGYTWTAELAITPDYDRRDRRQVRAARKLEENGSIYIFRPYVLREYHKRLGGKVECYEMHPLDSFQVDTLADVELMEQLMPLRLQVHDFSS